jgi:hypothetical protein
MRGVPAVVNHNVNADHTVSTAEITSTVIRAPPSRQCPI